MTNIFFGRYELYLFKPLNRLVLLELPNVEYRGSETIVHSVETLGM